MKEISTFIIGFCIGLVTATMLVSVAAECRTAKVVSDGYCVYSNQVYRMEPVTGSGDTCDEE